MTVAVARVGEDDLPGGSCSGVNDDGSEEVHRGFFCIPSRNGDNSKDNPVLILSPFCEGRFFFTRQILKIVFLY